LMLSALVVCLRWLIFLSLLATARGGAFKTRAHKLTQRAVSTFLAPQKHGARQSGGCLNPSFSRILTRTRFAPYALGQAPLPRKPAKPHAYLPPHFFMRRLLDPRCYFLRRASRVSRPRAMIGCRHGSVYVLILADGFTRIARGVPWAGSVTGGEACGYPCSEKEGFTHPSFLRAPCFWGAKNVETAR
jgi:hypothetical protein